jgi:hypothetical protein
MSIYTLSRREYVQVFYCVFVVFIVDLWTPRYKWGNCVRANRFNPATSLHFSLILIVCHSFVTFLWRKLYACRIEKTVLKLAVVYNTMGFSTHKFSNKSHHPRHAKNKDNGPMHIQIGLGTGFIVCLLFLLLTFGHPDISGGIVCALTGSTPPHHTYVYVPVPSPI